MRVSPLICWECKNWFKPISKRKQRYCSGACRQQAYYTRRDRAEIDKYLTELEKYPHKAPKKSSSLIALYYANKDEHERFKAYCKSYCKDNYENCIECWFENDFDSYRIYVVKHGRDLYDRSMNDWLHLGQP